jgi:DNA-binding CsgD family transcriptional regulator
VRRARAKRQQPSERWAQGAAAFPRARGEARRVFGRLDSRFLMLHQDKEDDVEKTVRLTGREAEVLRLIARGCTYAQAAEELGMSLHTAATHMKNAYRKLDVHSAAAAVMRAIQLNLLC